MYSGEVTAFSIVTPPTVGVISHPHAFPYFPDLFPSLSLSLSWVKRKGVPPTDLIPYCKVYPTRSCAPPQPANRSSFNHTASWQCRFLVLGCNPLHAQAASKLQMGQLYDNILIRFFSKNCFGKTMINRWNGYHSRHTNNAQQPFSIGMDACAVVALLLVLAAFKLVTE